MRGLLLKGDERVYGVHGALFCVIYTLYGQHICPILNSKDFWAVLAPCALALGTLFFVRRFVLARMERLATDAQLRWGFWMDFGLFIVAGVVVSAFNWFYFRVPTENVLKVSTCFVALGYYISLDLSLRREHAMARRIIAGEVAFPRDGRSMPVTQKFTLFSIANLVILATVCLLVVYKDLIHMGRKGMSDTLLLLVLAEITFVVAVLAGYTVNAIHQYSRNLKLSLESEHNTLKAVSGGDLQNRAPVTSRDEFGEVARLTNHMIEQLETSIDTLTKTQNAFLVSLVSLAAKRDNETGMHLRRTQHYIAELARTLRQKPSHRDRITKHCVDLLFQAAPLHDIGKVGIPDAILQKRGKLTEGEFDVMKTHTSIGAAALEDTAKQLEDSRLVNMACEIVISHHERWDGKGYPHGTQGEDIPLSGRLMAVADVYDALRSRRVYKPAMGHDQAVAIIKDGRGTQFDPAIVDAFLECEGRFKAIAERYRDEAIEAPSLETPLVPQQITQPV
ncbi:MAG: HD domain-containing phosphohydrolase [Pseudomonadota bacterium]